MALIDPSNTAAQFNNISRLPLVRQLLLLFGLAASVALGVAIVLWSKSPDYAPLYGDLSSSESAQVVDALEKAGVKYELNRRTGMISVPADQVHQTRLTLAGDGLPRSDSRGFDFLYGEQQLGVSSFMEKARYDRAVESELARTITSLESVKSARVHLAMPKPSVFIRKTDQPEASVLLNLYGGRTLSEEQLAGIVHLVASSVPGLEAEQVSVIDQRGQLLSAREQQDGLGFSKEQFKYVRQLEEDYRQRIVEILSPLVGARGVRAQVAADLDFTRAERTSEVYDPETAVRSEQLVEEVSRDRGARGVPGTLSNQPPAEALVAPTPADGGTEAGGEAEPRRSSKRETRNYEVDKTISYVREPSGVLRRLSVAVVLDYREQLNAQGAVERVALTPEELARMTGLIKEAVGFNEERGDTVNVINASFVTPQEVGPPPVVPLWERPWLVNILKLLLGALAILLLIFGVLKPFLKSLASAGAEMKNPPALQDNSGAALSDGLGDDPVSLSSGGQRRLPPGRGNYQQQINRAQAIAREEPGRAVQVVRNWVQADG